MPDTDQTAGQVDGKVCPQCEIWKPRSEYKKRKITPKSKSGMNSECKECESKRNRRNYLAKREYRIEQARLWREANPEKRQAYDVAYRERHPDRVKESAEKWYATDPLAKNKKATYAAEWRARNPDKVKEIIAKSSRKRQQNPEVRINDAIGRAIRSSLPRGGKAGRRTFSLLGYSKQELMEHLERQFKTGMTWDNYGLYGWHIDHIRPKTSFEFETTEDAGFGECWALSNLQPLWAKENLKKHASLTWNAANDNTPRTERTNVA